MPQKPSFRERQESLPSRVTISREQYEELLKQCKAEPATLAPQRHYGIWSMERRRWLCDATDNLYTSTNPTLMHAQIRAWGKGDDRGDRTVRVILEDGSPGEEA